jgi:hypothetical protein
MKKLLPLSLLLAARPVLAQDVAGAIPACKDKAPRLVKEKRDETGWAIRRVSLKTRNAERATPDLWEARPLADFNIRGALMVKRAL